jgi:hypothetical protein
MPETVENKHNLWSGRRRLGAISILGDEAAGDAVELVTDVLDAPAGGGNR